MKRTLPILTGAGMLVSLCALPAYASLPACEAVVKEANALLEKQDKPAVQEVQKLVVLLQALNRGNILPAEYVTRSQAMEQGWSGRAEDPLWNVWSLNKKQLGGDRWPGKAPPVQGSWRWANRDSVRGLPSETRSGEVSTLPLQRRCTTSPSWPA